MHSPHDGCNCEALFPNQQLDALAELLKLRGTNKLNLHDPSQLLNDIWPAARKVVYGDHYADRIVAEMARREIRNFQRGAVYNLKKLAPNFTRDEVGKFPTLGISYFLAVIRLAEHSSRLQLLQEAADKKWKFSTLSKAIVERGLARRSRIPR